MPRLIAMALVGLLIGFVVGIALFDEGPGLEGLVVVASAVGAAAGLAWGRRDARTR